MRILIVDDHLVVRQGVARLLSAAIPGLHLSEATDADAALGIYRQGAFDLVIIDVGLPGSDGLSLLKDLFALDDRVRALMFSVHAQAGYAGRALRLGARGYVSKCAPAEELVEAVKAIAAGGRYIESGIATELALVRDNPKTRLTQRETEILRLLGEGKTLREIATTSGRTYKTISNTISAIKIKLGVQTSGELLRLSIMDTLHGGEDA